MKILSKTIYGLTILALFSMTACGRAPRSQSAQDLQGTIAISGAFALYPIVTRWAEEFQKLYPHVQFDISAGGAGKGMADVLSNAVDIGMVSRQITPEEQANGAFWVAVTKDAVFPTINAHNPVVQDLLQKGISRQAFIGIFITGEIKTWGQVVGRPEITDEIHVYTRSDACGAAETWAKYLEKNQEDLLGVAVFGDPGLLDAVLRDPSGIGYNNLGYAYDMASGQPVAGTLVLPLDSNADGLAGPDELLETKSEAIQIVAAGKYPSPPARDLYLVTRGKPGSLIQAFLVWVLTEGQKFVGEAGYIALPQVQLDQALQSVK